MKLKTSVYSQFVPIFISLVIYIILGSLFLLFFKDISLVWQKPEKKIIVEGILLPKVDNDVNEIFNVDPLLTSSTNETLREIRKKVSTLIFSSLFKESIKQQGVIPEIVENYTFTNAKDLELKIREDVFWTDGRQLTTEDIEYTLKLIGSLGQSSAYYGASNGNDIQITIIDPYRMKVSLIANDGDRPNSAYLNELVFPILPKHVLENYPKPRLTFLPTSDFGQHPVGSGILKFQKNYGAELDLMRNDKYFGDKVKFDSYKMRFYKDYNALVRDYQLKNVDISFIDDILKDNDLNKQLLEAGAIQKNLILRNRKLVLYFNVANQTSDSSYFIQYITLRRALLNIIDRKVILEDINGQGREVIGPIDQTSWAFDAESAKRVNVNVQEFDKAAAGLGFKKNNGFYQKDSKDLALTITYLEGDVRDKIIESLKKQFESNGVKLLTKRIPVAPAPDKNTQQENFADIVNNRAYESILTGIDLTQDPDVYNEWHSNNVKPPGLNLSGFSNGFVDRALVDARLVDDKEKRKAEYAKFQKRFFEESPAIYLLNPATQVFVSPRVENINLSEVADSNYFYRDISKWEVKPKYRFN